MRRYELRDPIHGFIEIDEWERDIINQPAFQRLRRIKQLAWTDMVYPGATHTRFEHSLGVMHVATRLYDAICNRAQDLLTQELKYDDGGLKRQRRHGSVEIPAIILGGQAGLVIAHAMFGWGTNVRIAQRFRLIRSDLLTIVGGAALLLVWAGTGWVVSLQYHGPDIYPIKIAFGTI